MRDVALIMEKIMQVRSGLMTVERAAEELCISRKTWYEWENKALSAMCLALQPGDPGRPRNKIDPEKENLKVQLKQMQKKLILTEQDIEIRKLLFGEIPAGVASKKK